MTLNQNCEDFEPLISALIDDELSVAERDSLNAHLDNCAACKALFDEFHEVDRAVSLLGAPGNEYDSGTTETFVVTRQKPTLKNWMSVWRLVPLGAVASLLIGLFLVAAQPTPEATAEQFSPDEFVEPMAELNRINLHQQRDQELMIRTLGMNLRTLRLELKQLEGAGPEDRKRLEKQIESMLERVDAFERND